jgi:8-oxo-dGTP pyrophosphatase MutT (NUDIX family)
MQGRKSDLSKKIPPQTFRANVGAIIINGAGLVLALERKEIPGSWQCPQGGLDEGEEPLEAVRREILEETGIKASSLELLGAYPHWLVYEFPEEVRAFKTWRGQAQKWYLFRLEGADGQITLGDGKEFRAWKWLPMERLLPKVVDFKRPVYQELAHEFEPYFKGPK